MGDLKACPFCGHEAEFKQRTALTYHVVCGHCGASTCDIPIPSFWAGVGDETWLDWIKDKAEKTWNRRTYLTDIKS